MYVRGAPVILRRMSASRLMLSAVLPAATASLLHARPGSTLSLRDRDTGARLRIRLTGIFRPVHPAAGYWALDLIGASGASRQGAFVTYGPLIVDPGVFATGELATDTASWVAVPDRQRIGGDLTALAGRVTRMTSALSLSPRFGGLQASTSLPALLAGLGAGLVVARSVLVIGGLLLLILVAAPPSPRGRSSSSPTSPPGSSIPRRAARSCGCCGRSSEQRA